MKKTIISALLLTMVAGTFLTGCNSSSQEMAKVALEAVVAEPEYEETEVEIQTEAVFEMPQREEAKTVCAVVENREEVSVAVEDTEEDAEEFAGIVNIVSGKCYSEGIGKVECTDGYIYDSDVRINMGGGNVVIKLNKEYSLLDLTAALSVKAPTKAKLQVKVYGDSNLLFSYEDFDTEVGSLNPELDVTGVDTLTIEVEEHTYIWVSEAAFAKPDQHCHFGISLY